MATTDPDDPDAPSVMAAELSLGLLDGADRAVALRRQLAEPAFALEVDWWRAHFAALFAQFPEVAPPPELGARIAARIDGRPAATGGWWKPMAIASSLAAASLLGVVLVRPDPNIAPPVVIAAPAPLVAAMTLPGRDAPVAVVYDAKAGSLKMAGTLDIPSGRDAQLWAIVGTAPPQPLGLFRAAESGMMADARNVAPFAAGTTFAISIEPVGGSPTGAPTGPVIASGVVAAI